MNAGERVHVGNRVLIENTIVVDPSRESGGVSLRDEETRRRKRRRGWSKAAGLNMLLEERFEGLAVLLGAVVLATNNGHVGVFELNLVKDISGQAIKVRDIGRETISELSLERGIL